MNKIFDVIVVGAGYAGLCASYYLKKNGSAHLIFERGQIAESWRSQRWDNFRFNSTNKLNLLPGEVECDDPDSFETAPHFADKLRKYVSSHNLPVEEHSNVISIEPVEDKFLVKVESNTVVKNFLSRQILIASGAANEIRTPGIAKSIAKEVTQLHTTGYKNADQLPQGAVLVVGGAQSGIQITEDLLNAGRKVFLATSLVGRIPRYYRGRDIFYWIRDAKVYDVKTEELEDPKLIDLKPPHVSGTGDGKTTLSLQSIAKRGAIILGKLHTAEGTNLTFAPDAAEHIRFADEFSQKIKTMIDNYIEQNNLPAPAPHLDEEDIPDTAAACASSIISLDLEKENINSIIWATGFDHDLSYIKLPVLDENGKLLHKNGEAYHPGLYFLGFPWLLSRKSPILFGIIEDAEYIVNKICEHSKRSLASAAL